MKIATTLLLLMTGCLGTPGGSSPTGTPGGGDDTTPPGGGDDDPTPPAPLTPSEFVHNQNVKDCDYAYACKASTPDGVDPATFEAMYGTTAATCYDLLDTNDRIPSIAGSITAGRVTYNEISATSCLATMVAPTDCATFFATGPTYPSVCIEALKGTVADGEQCAVDFDCLNDDSICDIENTICVGNE